jgi:membrane dipeptidase
MGRIAATRPQSKGLAAALFDKALVWDNHTCTTLTPHRAEWLAQLQRYRTIGVDMICMNVGFDAAPPQNALLLLAEFRRWLRAHPPDFALIERAADIDSARQEGRLGVCFNLEGGNALFENVHMVSLYYDLGVRWMLFAYNSNNALAGGCQDDDTGLTEFGRAVLAEMERVGMVVCCSHIGHRSAMEILERARKPVIFSHSNPRGLRDHPRNIRDEAIRACARTGGVIGINGIGIFLGENDITTELIVRHIDYVANMVGSEHVGLALDYVFDQQEMADFVKAHPETYPSDKYPKGLLLMEPERFPDIAEQLLKSGHSEDDVRNILGANHMRIAREVWV